MEMLATALLMPLFLTKLRTQSCRAQCISIPNIAGPGPVNLNLEHEAGSQHKSSRKPTEQLLFCTCFFVQGSGVNIYAVSQIHTSVKRMVQCSSRCNRLFPMGLIQWLKLPWRRICTELA